MADELFSVRGQTVLVTGASRGIGRAIAAGFAERGAKVAITGREQATLDAAAAELSKLAGCEHPVTPIVSDMAKPADIAKLAEVAPEKLGAIDTLVNVAGVNRRMPAVDYTEADFDFILDINLKGPFLISQAIGKQMLARGKGNQINIASLNNFAPLKHVAPYAMSKIALSHMTRSLAMEWGPRGIRVNAISPGFIMTDLTRKLWSQPHMQAWNDANCPLKRLGQPEDMVGAAIFLASPASSFLTGQTIFVDGGFTAGLPWPIDQK